MIEVGQHKHQFVAACIVDAAAVMAQEAGLGQKEPHNFDPQTRHMVCAAHGDLRVVCLCMLLPHKLQSSTSVAVDR
jgi:hypothetical protein